ncbi:MAG: hypothetical protein IJ438_01950 [Clostridia bacterium]|nr:hypothetical protein [Clostridia bacterium]
MCLFLTLFCLFGKRNGAVQLVHLYEKDVQERAVSLGLITPDRIRRNMCLFRWGGMVLYIACLLVFAYAVNGAHTFADGFLQMLVILLIMGVYDRIVIDFWWVDHTDGWLIPGTEDLRPYIPAKVHLQKWLLTLVVYPAMAAALAGVMSLIL